MDYAAAMKNASLIKTKNSTHAIRGLKDAGIIDEEVSQKMILCLDDDRKVELFVSYYRKDDVLKIEDASVIEQEPNILKVLSDGESVNSLLLGTVYPQFLN